MANNWPCLTTPSRTEFFGLTPVGPQLSWLLDWRGVKPEAGFGNRLVGHIQAVGFEVGLGQDLMIRFPLQFFLRKVFGTIPYRVINACPQEMTGDGVAEMSFGAGGPTTASGGPDVSLPIRPKAW